MQVEPLENYKCVMACTGGDGSQGQRKRPAQASLAGLWGKKVSNPQKDLRDAKMKVMQAKVFGQVEPGAILPDADARVQYESF